MTGETCWTLIRAVRDGNATARGDFVDRYLPAVRAYLRARWKGGPLISEVEDAEQEVFVRCFSDSGPLERVTVSNAGGFRAFLYGICRNVAREMESDRGRRGRQESTTMSQREGDDTRLSAIFDRAFARQVMREARERFQEHSANGDARARRRYELLSLRFDEGLAIRDIAQRWNEDAALVHKEYARARREYREALYEVVAEQDPDRSRGDVEAAAKHLLEVIR